MIILDLLLSAALGGFLHQTRHYTDHLPHGWREMTNYSLGVIGTGPAYILWWLRLKDVNNPLNRAFLAFILAFIGVGSGVAAGWMLDTFQSDDERRFL
jgi:hypothetical protein